MAEKGNSQTEINTRGQELEVHSSGIGIFPNVPQSALENVLASSSKRRDMSPHEYSIAARLRQ
jgi:hypothetical protein